MEPKLVAVAADLPNADPRDHDLHLDALEAGDGSVLDVPGDPGAVADPEPVDAQVTVVGEVPLEGAVRPEHVVLHTHREDARREPILLHHIV